MTSLVIKDFKYDFGVLTSHVVVPYRNGIRHVLYNLPS